MNAGFVAGFDEGAKNTAEAENNNKDASNPPLTNQAAQRSDTDSEPALMSDLLTSRRRRVGAFILKELQQRTRKVIDWPEGVQWDFLL